MTLTIVVSSTCGLPCALRLVTHYHPATMDNSPTALFDSYEQDFQQIVQSISQKLDGDAKEERGGTYSTSLCSIHAAGHCGVPGLSACCEREEIEAMILSASSP